MSMIKNRKTQMLIFMLIFVVVFANVALGIPVSELFSSAVFAFFIGVTIALVNRFTKADV